MTETHEEFSDMHDVLLEDDVEALRKELLDLSENGEMKQTKAFLNNKKCTEKVIKKIMSTQKRSIE